MLGHSLPPEPRVQSKPIAIVQGAESAAIQALFRAFADRHAGSARIVGAIEEGEPGRRRSNRLHVLSDGSSVPVFQDLGSGASGCALDPTSVIEVSEAVRAGIAAGCDLVVLSKFGKMEALSGSGLVPAFAAAIEAGVPVLTSVAPKFAAEWESFASPFYIVLPAEETALDAWWRAVRE